MWENPQETADLVTFTEEILNGKFHFFALGIRHRVYQLDLNSDQFYYVSLSKNIS